MSKIELPPLPPADVYRATWDSGWSQYHDESDPLPAVWDDTAPDEVQGFFSGDQLRARDRQIVELCASLADKLALSRLERAARNNGRDSDFAFGYVNAAEELGAAIRSLLDPASPSSLPAEQQESPDA